MKSADVLKAFIEDAASLGLTAIPVEGLFFHPDMAARSHELFAAIKEDLTAQGLAWTPGQKVDAGALVTGAQFKDFYQNGWDTDYYHDDAEIPCEDETGNWLLEDFEVYPLSKLGYSVWQGKNGQPHRSGEFFPIYEQFGRWAEERFPSEGQENKGTSPAPM